MNLISNNIDSCIYPVPRNRIATPKLSAFSVGDFVRAKVGGATGHIGTVVCERNGNYSDFLDQVNFESIGVGFAESEEIDKLLAKLATISVIRWFSNPEELELLSAVGDKNDT